MNNKNLNTWTFEPIYSEVLPTIHGNNLLIESKVPIKNLNLLFSIDTIRTAEDEEVTADIGARELHIKCTSLVELINYLEDNNVFDQINVKELIGTNITTAVKISDVQMVKITKNTVIECHFYKMGVKPDFDKKTLLSGYTKEYIKE